MPTIRTKIQLLGQKIDPQIIGTALSMQPSKTKRASEYPSQTVLAGRAVDLWQWDTEKAERRAISDEIDIVQGIWTDKVQQLHSLFTQYNLCCHVTIVIELLEDDELPELVLTASNLRFLSAVEAEFGIDIY